MYYNKVLFYTGRKLNSNIGFFSTHQETDVLLNSRSVNISLCRNHVFCLNPPDGDELNMRSTFTTSNWFKLCQIDSLYTEKEIMNQLEDATHVLSTLIFFAVLERSLLRNYTWWITIFFPHHWMNLVSQRKVYKFLWSRILLEFSNELDFKPANALVKHNNWHFILPMVVVNYRNNQFCHRL